MSYRDYLTRYGSPAETGEIRFNIYIQDPAKLTTPKDIIWRDKYIAEDITRLENVLEDLRDYRQAIAARYAQLETMPYARLLRLERCPHWKGHIEYAVAITRTMEDGTQIQELREVYPGKERKKAFERFAALRKQYPGIPAEQDTDKKQWER